MKLQFCVLAVIAAGAAHAQTSLDTFVFDDSLFGDTLLESDGGAFSFSNWLNVNNVSPGNPGFLTGANFDTGIANIGQSGNPVYTIGYNVPIFNNPGDDLGIVVARYSEDTITFAVSADGVNFTADTNYGFETAIDTGVHKQYYYGGGGPYDAELFVQSVDLSDYGLALGDSIVATRITGSTQLDLVRAAGYLVPEPSTIGAFAVAGLAFFVRRRRR